MVVQPVFLYGSEVSGFAKMSQRRLVTFENKVLHRIFGPVLKADTWRVSKNRELGELSKRPDIIGVIGKKQDIKIVGQLQRRNGRTTIKKAWGKEDRMELER